jgi:hypothetical protein
MASFWALVTTATNIGFGVYSKFAWLYTTMFVIIFGYDALRWLYFYSSLAAITSY